MALLIDIRQPDWMTDEALAERLSPMLPGALILTGPRVAPAPEVRMLAVSRLHPDQPASLPGLKLVQKLGAGVETILAAVDLSPSVRVARLRPATAAEEIGEYVLSHLLARLRHHAAHAADARARRWVPRAPRRAAETPVLVLGLGHVGAAVARRLAGAGFPVTGWSRSAKAIPGLRCLDGRDALDPALSEAEAVVAALPSTPATRGLLGAGRLAVMQPGSVLVNVGRGDVLEEAALLEGLQAGQPGRAILDVFAREPLPEDHPFWTHPGVTVTPHVSGWHLDDGLDDVAENYRRLVEGRPLLHEVDRAAGY